MFRVLLQKFTIILVCNFFVESNDLLNLFRPKPDLPRELNEFLTEVQQHKKDFAYIQNVAKNKKKYEKSMAENHQLFAEDLDNQLAQETSNGKQFIGYEEQNPQNGYLYVNNKNNKRSGYKRENSIRSFYPNERYSRYIHSPVRFRRKFEPNYLDTHVQLNPNGMYGEIKRSEPKLPRNRFVDEQNRYHTGYVVGMDDEEDDDYYLDLRPVEKKKREVEISIKSDGKLVKKIEESENGPKSIVLNIKANGADAKSLLESSAAQGSSNEVISPVPLGSDQQNNKNNNGPSNSKTIPSVSNNNENQNGAGNQNVGVPINSIPASNSAFSNNNNNKFNAPRASDDNAFNSKNNQPMKNNNYNMQEISKVSNLGGKKQNMEPYESKSLSGYKPGQYLDNVKWSGSNNQMAKTIDIAQDNDMGRNRDEPSKESDFERVEGMVIDSTSVNSVNAEKNNFKYFKKRQSAKSKRWNEFPNALDSGVNKMSPLDFQQIDSNGVPIEKFDYIGPIESQNLPALPISDINQPNPQYLNWEVKDNSIPNNLDLNFNDLGYSTQNIIELPVNYLTTPCLIDVNLPKEPYNFEQKEEAKLIGKAIAQELEKQKVVEDGKYGREKEEESDTRNEIEESKGDLENMDANQLEAKAPQSIGHIDGNKIRHRSDKVQNENRKEMVQNKPSVPGHYQGRAVQRTYDNKRDIVKNDKYAIKPKQHEEKQNIDEISKSKREGKERHNSEDESLRNRKHLPTLPKYKKKRVRQHPKKRVDRDDETALVEYYDVNRLYGAPDDTFDFIPSYNKRQLKSVNYEFDPNLLHDVDNHEAEEIKEFKMNLEHNENQDIIEDKTKEKSNRQSQKYKGFRKKFKSEGDYSDEEDSAKMCSVSKIIPVKKSLNKLAPNIDPTTEENDDDYNYEDLSDMDKEDEDVAYEEEKADDKGDDQIEINNNETEHENDRFSERKIVTFMIIPQMVLETKTNQPDFKSLPIKANAYPREIDQQIFKIAETENENEGEKHDTQNSVHRGHSASSNKQRKMGKRKPRENEENDRAPVKSEEQDLNEGVSSLHGRGNPSLKLVKHKKLKTKRQDFETDGQKQNVMVIDKATADSFADKPLSNQQKQDLFLRYNPDFQRWPRFVQNDNKYREMMRERTLANQRRHFRNVHERNRFPISNEYFLSKPEVMKREEPAAEATTPGGETPAAATAAAPATDESTGTTEESYPEQKVQATETTPNMEAEGANKEGLSDATLPQAARNILQTANSDIFENTTAPSFESAEAGNQSVAAQVGDGPPTQFQFTTNADDLTQNDKCFTKQDDLNTLTPCPDENATHVPVTITSVLPLIPESATLLKVNMTKAEYLDLNEIVGGILPRHVVAKSLSCARGNLRRGLNSGKFNMNLQLTNYNSSAETRLILNEMTHLMLKLKYHTTCQILPESLKTYLKIITKNEMDSPMQKLQDMEDVDFDEHQSSYVFHGGDSENIQSKANAMKELLNKFNNLPENCKERAEPIKEYIESHLAMINSVGGKGAAHPAADTATVGATGSAEPGATATTGHPKAKKEISKSNLDYDKEKELDDQMMEDGMNNQLSDANRVIEDKDKTNKREAEDSGILNSLFRTGLSTSTSPQYGKLAEAVRKLQEKKENVKRIGEMYGRSKREELDAINREAQLKKENKIYESPLVLNF